MTIGNRPFPDFGPRHPKDQRTRDMLSYYRDPDPPHFLQSVVEVDGVPRVIEYLDKWGNSLCPECADALIEKLTQELGDDPFILPARRDIEFEATATCGHRIGVP